MNKNVQQFDKGDLGQYAFPIGGGKKGGKLILMFVNRLPCSFQVSKPIRTVSNIFSVSLSPLITLETILKIQTEQDCVSTCKKHTVIFCQVWFSLDLFKLEFSVKNLISYKFELPHRKMKKTSTQDK